MASLDPAICSGTSRNSCFGKSTALNGFLLWSSIEQYVLIEAKITKYGTPTSKIGVPYFYQHFRYCTLCRKGIGVDVIDNLFDSKPQSEICEHFHDTAVIRKGCILENGQIFHEAIVDDVLYYLVHEIDLIAIQRSIVQKLCKGFLGGIHIQAYDFADKLA